MLLNNAPVNEAIVSNVGEIGEFRIRNSAKAFNILSSGLYANKIRAIVRELSCNAVDSHVAAGKTDTPFDVHLPNQLEPWFAIRDYGTGLTHEQVTSIYTTYFESTKTDSNDYIGALGLGSKSPFSYTDNFTVTAIKDGKRGIYSAFINESGVPSIALMMTEDTTDPAGVEVKFSVNDRWDFSKFAEEARYVYTYFALRPVISGAGNFAFRDVEYETKDIVPGVHSTSRGHTSVAIMGNISYPIDVPNSEKNLGDLARLLHCGLELHFAIGELDFQASREGLSYIPQTVNSIKRKLEEVNAALSVVIAKEADAIPNLWDRAIYLANKKDSSLWTAAVGKYVVDTKFPLMEVNPGHYNHLRCAKLKLTADMLAKKYNIEIRGFSKNRSQTACSNLKSDIEYPNNDRTKPVHYWEIYVQSGVHFVKNNTKIGAVERAKFHWRNAPVDNSKDAPYSQTVFVLEPVDKTKPAKFDAFLKAIHSPSNVVFADDLLKKDRAVGSAGGKNVTIMRLEERGTGGYYASREMVWRDAGKADKFSTTDTFYYLPLSGYNVISKMITGSFSGKDFIQNLSSCGFDDLRVRVYGVRKTDIEFIKTQKNWVNVEDYIMATLKSATDSQKLTLAVNSIDRDHYVQYNSSIVDAVTNTDSPYRKASLRVKDVPTLSYNPTNLTNLCRMYGVDCDVVDIKNSIVDECAAVYDRYPLLRSLYNCKNPLAVAEYINLIDASKGV